MNEDSTENHKHRLITAPFAIQLDNFLGPIDLLLHLVKKNELEIEEVSLAYVADQYVQCLDQMREMDLEVAGEYLVIAATLLSIKSSVLLSEPVEFEIDADGNLLDPHQELLQRLREAAVYKEGAAHLGEMPLLGRDIFAPVSSLADFPTPAETYREHDPYLLGVAFQKLLKKVGESELRYEIALDSVSIVDQMMKVLKTLQASTEGESFEALVGENPSKPIVVGTFIALLELCKRQVIQVSQEEENIIVKLKSEEESEQIIDGDVQSEFDTPVANL